MGPPTSLRVAAWSGTSSPHDQHKAEQRQDLTIGFTVLGLLTARVPLHSPGTSAPPFGNQGARCRVGEKCPETPRRRPKRHRPHSPRPPTSGGRGCAEPEPSRMRAMDASDEPRVALLGYGYWGPNLARNLHLRLGKSWMACRDPRPAP